MKRKTYIYISCIFCIFATLSILMYIDKCNMNEKYNFDEECSVLTSHNIKNYNTEQYNLTDLLAFFDNGNLNEAIFRTHNSNVLTFDNVNDKFSEIVTRDRGYSIYKVTQGGYFYVFWVNSFSNENDLIGEDSYVYFSAYLSCDNIEKSFDSLIEGESTAADVKKIDPYLELSFLRSSGVYSYSFLDKDNILQIKYLYKGNIESYESLVVDEISILPRSSVNSKYSTIYTYDLP